MWCFKGNDNMVCKNRTHWLDGNIPARVKALAVVYNVTVADVVNFLLLYAIHEAESDQLYIPTPPGRALVDWQKVERSSTEG